jgi:hypothetical protein
LFPPFGILADITRNNDRVWMARIDHVHSFAKIVCRVRSAMFANMRIADLSDYDLRG